jgi:heme oxygenase (biliverdin-IX-beta and delta-forming)
VQQASNLLMQLNLATQGFHLDADAPWLDLMGPGRRLTTYMNRLVRAYGFEAPVEAALAYTPHVASLVDLRARARAGLIAQDLLALGIAPHQLTTLDECPITPFSSVAEALGWLYVNERSTLIHDVVRRRVLFHHPELAKSTNYLGAYHGHAGARWQELGAILDRVARTERIAEQIIESAQDAFVAQIGWHRYDVTPPAGAAAATFAVRGTRREPPR